MTPEHDYTRRSVIAAGLGSAVAFSGGSFTDPADPETVAGPEFSAASTEIERHPALYQEVDVKGTVDKDAVGKMLLIRMEDGNGEEIETFSRRIEEWVFLERIRLYRVSPPKRIELDVV